MITSLGLEAACSSVQSDSVIAGKGFSHYLHIIHTHTTQHIKLTHNQSTHADTPEQLNWWAGGDTRMDRKVNRWYLLSSSIPTTRPHVCPQKTAMEIPYEISGYARVYTTAPLLATWADSNQPFYFTKHIPPETIPRSPKNTSSLKLIFVIRNQDH